MRMVNSFVFVIGDSMVDATDLSTGSVELVALGDTLSGGSRRAFLRCSGWAPPFEMRTPEVGDERVWRLSMRVIRIKVRRLFVAKYDIPGTAMYVQALCVGAFTESMFQES